MTTEQKKLQGVWQVTEFTTTGPNATTNRNPQPGFWIFSGRHYSLTRVTGNAPRKGPADTGPVGDWPELLGKATAEELRELLRFGAHAGTYETKGGELILHPAVGLRPRVMAPGSTQTFAYKLEGDSLSMTLRSTRSGPATNPTTTKLRRIE